MFPKKNFSLVLFFMTFLYQFFPQEALKSTEEEYYDFLSLTGITERPTLGYRTLSDNQWKFVEKESPVLDAEGNPLLDENGNPIKEKVLPQHVWQENNLGSKRVLWQSESKGGNWFTRGFDHSIKFKAYGPEWYNSFNTAAPYGQNDGALWQGKGYNTSLTGGVRIEGYGFELTFKPQVCFSQNLEFELMPLTDRHSYKDSEFVYFWSNIDMPQRFGDEPFWTFSFGDSEIRYTWKKFTLGFGNQTPWIGPAWLNGIIGSNNAPSYTKFDFGIRKTTIYFPHFGWEIGDIETRIWTGKLNESDYYDKDESNDSNMLHAMSFSYRPSIFRNLTITLNRIILYKWKEENLLNIYRLVSFDGSNGSDSGNDEDQKYSVSLDLLFPTVGFELYAEIGKDDFSKSFFYDLTLEETAINPFHTLCYTIGSKKTFTISKKNKIHGNIIFELSSFEMSQDFQLQWGYFGYYGHGFISQGYTNRGQIIGAGSGYAGNTQYLGVNVYYPKGSTSIFFHRNSPDTNFIYNKAVYASAAGRTLEAKYWSIYKTILTVGVKTNYFVTKNLSLSGGFIYSRIIDELYYHKTREIENYEHTKTHNFQITFGMKYNF